MYSKEHTASIASTLQIDAVFLRNVGNYHQTARRHNPERGSAILQSWEPEMKYSALQLALIHTAGDGL
jgi:hypothetical protein